MCGEQTSAHKGVRSFSAGKLTVIGFRQAQQILLDAIWEQIQSTQPVGRRARLISIEDESKADMMLTIGAAFVALGVGAFTVLGGAAVPAAVTTGFVIAGVGGG